MNKKLWILISAVWLLTLAGSFMLGRSHARGWGKAAQVEYMMEVAFREQLPTLEMLQKIRALSDHPIEVNAFLRDYLETNQQEAFLFAQQHKENQSIYQEFFACGVKYNDALKELCLWEPGQTGPKRSKPEVKP